MATRRSVLQVLPALLMPAATRTLAADTPLVQVYKSSTCSCCNKWVSHLKDAGFSVEARNVPNVNAYKLEFGVPANLVSCHTAVVEGFVVEGHVPADDVIRLLRQKPAIKGIAVAGMPIGSPGMEGPNPEFYQTIAFDAEGAQTVFAEHGPAI